MSVDNDGVTVIGAVRFTAGNSMILANNLVYGASGQVLNPATGDLLGTFSGIGFNSIHTIDTVNNRAFFLTNFGSTLQLRAYDLNTFLPLGFANVSGFFGTPSNLVRWGTNGLAFRTSNQQIVLVETSLVNASVPVPAATPTPSPTPSPSPPYVPTFIRRLNLPANSLVYSNATQSL